MQYIFYQEYICDWTKKLVIYMQYVMFVSSCKVTFSHVTC